MALTYDGFNLTQYAFVQIERPVAPSVRVSTEDVPGRDGTRYVGATLDKYAVTAHCVLRRKYIPNWATVRNTLAVAFTKREPCELYIPDDAGRYRMATARIDASVREPLMPPVAFDIYFECQDPFSYGDLKTATIPSGGSVTINIDGMFATEISIVATSAVRNSSSLVWGVRFDEGDFLHVATGSSSSRSVEIDCGARSVKIADATAMVTLDSLWPQLESGSHVARMDQGTGAATLKWREGWL